MGHRSVPKPPDYVPSPPPMVRQFRTYWKMNDPNYKDPEPVWEPRWYFLVGPLMHPPIPASVLDKPNPEVGRANVLNLTLKPWGDLPALIWNGRTQHRIRGTGYEVQSQEEEEEDRLDAYLSMGGKYKKQLYDMWWDEAPHPRAAPMGELAVVYLWDGDSSLLTEEELDQFGIQGWLAKNGPIAPSYS